MTETHHFPPAKSISFVRVYISENVSLQWSTMSLVSIQCLIYIGCHASLTTLIFRIRESSLCYSSVTEKDTCYGVSPCYDTFVWPSTSSYRYYHCCITLTCRCFTVCLKYYVLYSTDVFCMGLFLRCYFI